MKPIYLFLCTFCFSALMYGQANTPAPVNQDKTIITPDVISLKESEFNFGKIPQGKPVTHVFYFTNAGTSPLVLDNVQTSCGCTSPEWNKDPVAAGATAKINVGFSAMTDGPFSKFITILYNGTQTKQITIKGDVWKTPTTSAPENAALNILKTQL